MSKTIGFKSPPKVQLPSPFTRVEKECFQKYLALSTAYFEFGSGATTQMANKIIHLRDITSIECEYEYAKQVSDICPRVNVIYVDIGATDTSGWPTETSLEEFWYKYSQMWTEASKMYDTVLLAGRFRLACALWICLNPREVKVIMFANFVDRPEYHAITDFVEIVEVLGNLAVMRPKQRFDRMRCQALYDQVKSIP